MTIRLRPMTMDDYDEVFALWRTTEGVGLAESDERGPMAAYLARNPGLSTVAVEETDGSEERIVGAMLSGHNGRRGEFVHLAVAATHRGRGIGRRIVEHCLQQLAGQGVSLCNLYVFADNQQGMGFWRRLGFRVRDDVFFMQGPTDRSTQAP